MLALLGQFTTDDAGSNLLGTPDETTRAPVTAVVTVDELENKLVRVARTRAYAPNERRQTRHRCDRFQMSDGQLDTLRVFDGDDDEHDVERLQVEIVSEMMNGIDRIVIDPEMLSDGSADDVIEMVVHGLLSSEGGSFGLGSVM